MPGELSLLDLLSIMFFLNFIARTSNCLVLIIVVPGVRNKDG